MRTLIIVENLNNYNDATVIINGLKQIKDAEHVFIEPQEGIVEIIHRNELDMEAIKIRLLLLGYPPAEANNEWRKN